MGNFIGHLKILLLALCWERLWTPKLLCSGQTVEKHFFPFIILLRDVAKSE